MLVTLDLPDDFANEMLADVPQQDINSYVTKLLMQNYQPKKRNKLPFPILPSRGVVVTNDLVNQLREQEGI